MFFGSQNNKTENDLSLNLEVLENRMMLSSVEIFAAGATGQENLDLLINGEVVQTFFSVGGDASTGAFRRFTFETDQTITPGNIGIGFSNDAFDPSTGLDRNLFVDRIAVDGVSVEAEDPSTFRTGIYRDGLTGPGFLQTDVLNINGTLTFADPGSGGGDGSTGSGDLIQFDALGTTGEEFVNLLVNGEVVQSFGFAFAQPGTTQTFNFQSDDPNISIEDIRLEFTNDAFDASTGLDRNVQISEFRVIDGDTGTVQSASTSDSNVLSSGIFADGAITEGFGAGGFLAGNFDGNAFVEISGGVGSTGSGDLIQFDALGTTGEEIVNLLVNGQVVETFGLFDPGTTQTFNFQSDDPNISLNDIRLEFVNDAFDASTGLDRNVQIFEFRVIDGETGAVQTARTTDANVLNSGIFVNGSITQGFGAGGFLAGDFGGNGFVEIRDNNDSSSGVTAIASDPGFQVTQGSLSFQPAIGPADQIASITPFNEIQVVGSNGVPLFSFGGNGQVDLEDLLNIDQVGQQVGFGSTDLEVSDLEFFDDGSLLVTGVIREAGVFGVSPATPVVAKLNPDGTLDQGFQQGIVQGTLIQIPENTAAQGVEAAIDNSGRIILFSTNVTDPSAPTSYIVSRLNPNGTIDSSFGNNGNTFILGSSFSGSDFLFPSGTALGVDVLDNGDIIYGFSFLGIVDGAASETVVVSRLSDDGNVDQGFGGNGFFVRSLGNVSGDPLFQVTPDGGAVFLFDPMNSFEDDSLLLVNPDGFLISETRLPLNSGILTDGTTSTPDTIPTDLAVDQAGNIVVTTFRASSPFDSLPNVIQRILPTGELDFGFGLDGAAILGFTGATDIIFDSQNRLVVVGEDRTRFEFV